MKSPLLQKALNLSYFTVAYNILEGVISIALSLFTGSIALLGFGVDSFIESISGSVMIWRFTQHTVSEEEEERIEKKAARLVGYSFFLLGAYILFESVKDLYLGEAPEPSVAGIIIAVLSLIIMPWLAHSKRKVGKLLKSKSLVADSQQTFICTLMSIALFFGLGLHFFFGLWWADSVAGLFFTLLTFKEGYTTLKEEKMCDC
ncbi:MAG: cation transporter [Candidatus Gracilibacteria bacterium]